MGSGLAGGPLTGNVTTAALPPAPAGQSAVLSGPLGAGASDIVTKIGSTVADASINATAHVMSVRGGIGGTETEYFWVDKNGGVHFGTAGLSKLFGASASANFVLIDDTNGIRLSSNSLTASFTSASGLAFSLSGGATAVITPACRFDQSGTDSSGAPGNATIDKPTGKSAIAIGAASVTITCNQCSAASRVMISPHARDATCKELIVVPGAGSFVVSGSAAATAALPFSWEVSNIVT